MNTQMQQINRIETITISKVKKMYEQDSKGYWALKGVDLRICSGEFIAIVGKSGSGKSTLLNLLGGIDKQTEGTIVINGQKVDDMSENQLSGFRGANIGFIFQFFQLMPTLTSLENVLIPMEFLKKINKHDRKARAELLLEKVGLSDHKNKFPSALSGGEQQRVAIARALANDPSIILADEPTGNLDSKTSEDVFAMLEALAREGKNVVMVTHNEELAQRCDRIVRIRDGLIVEDVRTNGQGGTRA